MAERRLSIPRRRRAAILNATTAVETAVNATRGALRLLDQTGRPEAAVALLMTMSRLSSALATLRRCRRQLSGGTV